MKAFQFVLACLLGSTHAFAPHQGWASSRPWSSTTTTQRAALPVEPHYLTDMTVSWDQIQHSASQFLAVVDSTTTTVMADAMSDVVSSTGSATGEATGWWGSYINLFKSTLLWLHGTIDGPLRSVGFDQTWGVSIGLFTLCKYRYAYN